MTAKVSYCFASDNKNGLGNKVYIEPKRFKCSNTTVCGYVNVKNNIEELQRSEVPFPFGNLVHLNESQEGDVIIKNLKKGKAKWHKNCTLELSASK